MIIIGVDTTPSFSESLHLGEFRERRLVDAQESVKFYRALAASRQKIRAGQYWAIGHS
jgi:hypothetical protein